MSTRSSASTARGRAPARRRVSGRRRRQVLRRRLAAVALVLGVAVGAVVYAMPSVDKAVQEITLPLRHEDIIRQQSERKDLDPALVAGVIYAESHFRDQTSHAGARGLMQLTPDTAHYIAGKSGGTAFTEGDLATPQVNIAYGTWYLRYLLDKYDESTVVALAAYNGGEGNVDSWLARAHERAEEFTVARSIPFPETRAYVTKVLGARDRYRDEYRSELGL